MPTVFYGFIKIAPNGTRDWILSATANGKMGVALAAPILCYQPLKYSDWALTYNMFRFQQGKCK